ncbi:uncharacterized protein LOC144165323 [Haemaphysalis longicornis]
MPTDGATASTTPLVIVSHPREPGLFTGTDDVDVDDWLSLYERVSAHNRWDPTIMLANAIFYLKEESPARKWFETHETEMTSWEVFKTKLRAVFGKPLGRQLAARKELASRAQTSTESYVAYIQDVLALCSKADSTMTETDKVGHILKGIADDAFHLLMCKDCATVESIITECRRFEEAKGRRIAHNFTRLPHTAATSSCEDGRPPACISRLQDPVSPSADITKIVRRELEAMAPTTAVPYGPDRNELHTVSAIQAIVRDEIANLGLHPVRVHGNGAFVCRLRVEIGASSLAKNRPADPEGANAPVYLYKRSPPGDAFCALRAGSSPLTALLLFRTLARAVCRT